MGLITGIQETWFGTNQVFKKTVLTSLARFWILQGYYNKLHYLWTNIDITGIRLSCSSFTNHLGGKDIEIMAGYKGYGHIQREARALGCSWPIFDITTLSMASYTNRIGSLWLIGPIFCPSRNCLFLDRHYLIKI
jgi:hypothetical protein